MLNKWTGVLAAFFALLTACNNSQNSAQNSTGADTTKKPFDKSVAGKYAALEEAFSVDSAMFQGGRFGEPVSLGEARECIKAYDSVMQMHGFDGEGGRPRDLGRILSRKWTKSEVFAGDELLAWMDSMITAVKKTGATKVNFELHLGFYTEKFLTQRVSDGTLRNALRNRMTIFIIPRGNDKTVYTDDGEITSYELGGVQP